jgi:hypothetical protein
VDIICWSLHGSRSRWSQFGPTPPANLAFMRGSESSTSAASTSLGSSNLLSQVLEFRLADHPNEDREITERRLQFLKYYISCKVFPTLIDATSGFKVNPRRCRESYGDATGLWNVKADREAGWRGGYFRSSPFFPVKVVVHDLLVSTPLLYLGPVPFLASWGIL